MWKMTIGLGLVSAMVASGGRLADAPHPRLWFTPAMETEVRAKVAADPLAAKLQAAALSEAERVLTERPCRYELPDGKRLLAESRRALKNVMLTAWAWRLGGGEKFRLRAIAELEAACALKDWHPPHFLDTAEMATAVALGYDWLYPTLSPAQRTMCERAIIDKNVHIGDNVVITPEGKPENMDGENFYIRDGICCIPKDAIIPSGTWI